MRRLRIPAVPEIAALVGCRPRAAKRDWITHGGTIYSRVRVGDADHAEAAGGRSQGRRRRVVHDGRPGLAHNGGKRKGAVCTYLETWHLDIEEFLELRKNTGDDRRRTHDMNTANWIPDLFMKRVIEGGDWTLFSPSDVPDLHDKWGHAFEEAYMRYEEQGRARRDQAVQEDPRGAAVAEDAVDAVRDRASVDHVQGCVQRALAAAARRHRAQLATCAPRSRSTPARPRSPCATWARSTCSRT